MRGWWEIQLLFRGIAMHNVIAGDSYNQLQCDLFKGKGGVLQHDDAFAITI